LGNVVGFIPFGFILPVILKKFRSGFLIILSGFTLSLCVEVLQLIMRVGCFDVDDLILNTLGAALGYLAFFICDHIRRQYNGKKI
jgi:glycopeptide antibiotics resistance protein